MADDPGTSKYWEPCKGCKEGHSSYWKTVTESAQWIAWENDVTKRFHAGNKHGWSKSVKDVFDVDECRECGFISQRHFQAFLKFVTRRYRWSQKSGSKRTGRR